MIFFKREQFPSDLPSEEEKKETFRSEKKRNSGTCLIVFYENLFFKFLKKTENLLGHMRKAISANGGLGPLRLPGSLVQQFFTEPSHMRNLRFAAGLQPSPTRTVSSHIYRVSLKKNIN
jgi:hypothetical protein